jgi:hypothetical protein
MEPVEIVPGLWRWSAAHPEWKPEDDWGQMVGCVLYELGDVSVLIDPLLPREEREEFLGWLDARLAGRVVSVLTTIRWHRRDREALASRYGAGGTPRAWNEVPSGVRPRWLKGAGEIVYWLQGAGALVPGDSLIGDGHGGLALCPEDWLEEERVDRAGLAGLLQALLELPVERVLVSHGEPVLDGGHAPLARGIAEARAPTGP